MAGCYRCVLILGFLVSAIMRCFSTALLMTLAVAQDLAEGWMAHAISSLPSSVEHHPPRDDLDCRRGANVELGLLPAMVRHGSRRQSQLDSASEPLERKSVVDAHRVLSVVSRAQQQFPELHGAGRTDTPRSVGVQRRGRFTHPQPDGCGDRRDELSGRSVPRSLSCRTLSTRGCSLATRSLEMARSASKTLLSSATARIARFSSIHHAWDHTTVFLCCASSRGRHSKCRGGSCSSAVVFLVLSNRQHLLLSRLRHQWQLSHRA